MKTNTRKNTNDPGNLSRKESRPQPAASSRGGSAAMAGVKPGTASGSAAMAGVKTGTASGAGTTAGSTTGAASGAGKMAPPALIPGGSGGRVSPRPSRLTLPRAALILFSLLTFLFFGVFYKYSLYFQEQLQLFLLTPDYLLRSVAKPGGFAGYAGEFLTQFYHLPLAGALILTLLLVALQQLIRGMVKSMGCSDDHVLLSFLPSVWYALVLTHEFYLLSGLVGIVVAAALVRCCMLIGRRSLRGAAIVAGTVVTWFLTGGSFLLFLLAMGIYEFRGSSSEGKEGAGRKALPWLAAAVGAGLAAPLLVKHFLIMQPHLQAFLSGNYYKVSTAIPLGSLLVWITIPLLMAVSPWLSARRFRTPVWQTAGGELLLLTAVAIGGYFLFTNMSAERIKGFDYYVRQKKWDKVIDLARRDYPRNAFAVSYVNLALAKTGQLPDKMFSYRQVGTDGLYFPYNREHLTSMIGNEVFYELGLVNVSQQYIFESMEATPDQRKTVRALRRLAETNLINGQYEVTRKYCHMLKQTLFYRGWATRLESFLYDEARINADPEYGEKRKIRPRRDYFFDIHQMEPVLVALLADHPGNRMAFEYLMAGYLLNKELDKFMKYIPNYRSFGYPAMPQSYQEAVMYVLGLYSENPEKDTTFPISGETRQRLRQYASVYTSDAHAEETLRKEFWNSYWYYFHFR
ncbi:MAG: hypothetical protein KA780_01450 [Prolixibacteraceae bacterium]|jgi:hypothetical protein|nr:hypothetical protein [Prolixibacteraceae bacterium]